MRKLTVCLVAVLLLSALALTQVSPVYAETGNLVGTVAEQEDVNEGFQTKTFFANTNYWVFFHNGTSFYFCSSHDGATWSSSTTLASGTYGDGLSVDFDGTYVHYARRDHNNDNLYYRRGTPNSDGTITWSAVEQLVHDGAAAFCYKYPKVSVDSEGYAWIGAIGIVNSADYTPYALKNNVTDGTWVTDFAYQLDTYIDNFDQLWRVTLVPMPGGKMYFSYAAAEEPSPYPRGRLWNGTAMEANETISSNYYSDYGHMVGMVAVGNDIHIIYRGYVGEGGQWFIYVKRTWGVGWGAEELIDAPGVTTTPTLTVNLADLKLYVIYSEGNYFKILNKTIGSAWGGLRTFLNETTDARLASSKNYGAFSNVQNGVIGFLYVTKTETPYNMKFAMVEGLASDEYSRTASLTVGLGFGTVGSETEPPPPPPLPAPTEIANFMAYLLSGDIFGFFMAVYAQSFGSVDVFFGVVAMLIVVPLYIRTKSLAFLSIAWILLGSLFLVAAPLVSGVAVLFLVFGVASLLYMLFMRRE